MAEAALEKEKKTKKEVMRYATEQLHAVRPQPAGIPDMLAALQNALDEADAEKEAETVEEPPKDFNEAISRIDTAVGKLENPPKEKPDLKKHTTEGKKVEGAEGTGVGPHQEPKPAKAGISAGKNG
jgi:hypothetical protein